jgi:hypothetical protein
VTDHPTVTDWRGNTYTVGSTVLYPRASGRSVEMQEAEVLAIKDTEHTGRRYNIETRQYETYEYIKRTVRVMPAKSSRFDRSEWRGPRKATTILNVENITAVTDG